MLASTKCWCWLLWFFSFLAPPTTSCLLITESVAFLHPGFQLPLSFSCDHLTLLNPKRPRYDFQIHRDKVRCEARIRTGDAFERQRRLKAEKNLKTNEEVDHFLLDRQHSAYRQTIAGHGSAFLLDPAIQLSISTMVGKAEGYHAPWYFGYDCSTIVGHNITFSSFNKIQTFFVVAEGGLFKRGELLSDTVYTKDLLLTFMR